MSEQDSDSNVGVDEGNYNVGYENENDGTINADEFEYLDANDGRDGADNE